MTTGPDAPAILCYAPDACCGASPCAVDEDEFICQVRSLLPEGEPWNNTRPSAATPAVNQGAITVGCAHVGCEQLVLGGCCADNIPCEDVPVAPQLAVVDAFSAVGHGAVVALCRALRELDPCTADETIRHWADRFGIGRPDPCGPPFSDAVLAVLVCLFVRLRRQVINLAFLRELAAAFGADLVVRDAGDFNCGPSGWWTMARTRPACPEPAPCPPGPSRGPGLPRGAGGQRGGPARRGRQAGRGRRGPPPCVRRRTPTPGPIAPGGQPGRPARLSGPRPGPPVGGAANSGGEPPGLRL